MAISLSLNNVGITSAVLEISGLDTDTNYNYKRIVVMDANTHSQIDRDYLSTPQSSITYPTGNIFQSSTSYSIYVQIWHFDSFYEVWSFQGQSNVINFTTGGGPSNPTYVFQVVGSNINIDIIDAGPNCQFYAYLYDNPYGSGSPLYNSYSSSASGGFAGIPDGTYYLNIYYLDSNIGWIDLQNRYTEQIYSQVVIGGGPTPTGDWSYPTTPTLIISSNSTPIENSYSFNAKQGIFFTFYFQQSGTISVYSSYPSGGLTSYFGPLDTGFDPSNGQPYSYDYYYNGAFTYSYTGNQGDRVYLWVTRDSYREFTLNVTLSSQPIDAPTYTAQVVNNNQIQMAVSNRGDYYLRYFVRRSDSSSATYDSWEADGQLATYIGLTIPNLSYDTWYTVNVGYSTVRTSGQVTWIGSMELKTDSQPAQQFQYTLESGITVSNSQPSPKRISFSENHGVIVPITISYNGVVTVYTETDQSSRMDDQAYLCTSRNVSYDSAGVVDHSSQYYIKENDQGHGNNEFQMTIDNTNVGTNVYYLYIRGYPLNNIPRAINTLLYAKTSSGYVYIYDGSTWRQTIPYIYDGSTWREAIPYVYNGSAWQECGG